MNTIETKKNESLLIAFTKCFLSMVQRFFFLGLLSDKTQAIYNVAVLVRVVVGKQKSFEGQVRLPK
jgi:hypothetical protein